MKRNDAFEHYKSGINKITARANPFAEAVDENEDPTAEDAPLPAVRVRTNTRLLIAAAFVVCISIGAFLAVFSTNNIKSSDSKGQDISYQPTSTSEASNSTSVISTSAVSSLPDSSVRTVSSSLSDSSQTNIVTNQVITNEECRKAVRQFSESESKIQILVKQYSDEYNGSDRTEVESELIDKLTAEYQKEQQAVDTLMKHKNELPEVVILDTRYEDIGDSVDGAHIRVAVLNLKDTTITVQDKVKCKIGEDTVSLTQNKFPWDPDYPYIFAGKVKFNLFIASKEDNEKLQKYIENQCRETENWLDMTIEVSSNSGSENTAITCEIPYSKQSVLEIISEPALREQLAGDSFQDKRTYSSSSSGYWDTINVLE